MPKLIRITTVPISLKLLLSGQMRFIQESGWEVLMVSADGKEVDQVCRKEGCRHEVIPFTRKITPFQDLVCLWKLYKLFKKEKPDIVHSHTPKAGFLGMWAAKLAGVKHRIHTVAGLPLMVAEKQKKSILTKVEKHTYTSATEVWPNANSLKKIILESGMASDPKVKVLGYGSSNGVDLKVFNRENLKENHLVAATMRIMPSENDFIILAIGRLVKDKGIEELVEAFLGSKLANRAKLVLLGAFEQDLNPLSDETIRKIQDHPRIVHIEWTDHVAHYLAMADVLVHASHREGFPNVLLEAGAMQVPIICSDIPGNNDIVSNKKTGLLFPVKNVKVLQDALEFAYVKRDYMLQLAEALYVQIIERYDRIHVHQLILNEYQRLLEEQNQLAEQTKI